MYVNTIVKDGPADKAGLRGAVTDYYGEKHGGDVITALDKQNITKTDELITYIDQHTKPGDTVTLTVQGWALCGFGLKRGGKTFTARAVA